MDCILTVRSEVKIKFGAHVPGLWQAMDREGEGFADLGQTAPKISKANLKDRMFFNSKSQTKA
jgi:hypothetical protein